ncbi:MAG: SMP-30/gluconolactonase/LRE family protein [Rubrivivax sp.]|nr:SMP-30/gluconolactonase/LRE family protein [Rubrivivax sp.]
MHPGPVIPFEPSARMPEPRVEILDPRGAALRLFSATVVQLASGMSWAEGPVWFGDGRYLLVSDIPGNRILRWDECSGAVSVFRQPSNHANGHARDRQGRLISCEHLTRRVTRTEHDGAITVLAERCEGRRLNSPNDIVCQRNGAVWFTDPTFGIHGWWEGEMAEPERPHGVYRIDPDSGELQCLLDDLAGPNGLAFSPDERVLYVVESRARPHRVIWAYDVAGERLANKRLYVSANGPGAYDGIAVDELGNVWCGLGSDGSPGADPAGLDGVRAYDPQGVPLLHVHLPERCANLCFGGPRHNRLFMAAGHSLYALHVAVRGAA